MTLINFLMMPGLGPFIVSSMLIFFLGVGIALGLVGEKIHAELNYDHDLDIHIDQSIDSGLSLDKFFTFLNIGKVPFTIWLIIFCAAFSFTGFALQFFVFTTVGFTLNAFLASGITLLPTVGLTKMFTSFFAKNLPMVQTNAIYIQELVGSYGQIITGIATTENPAEVKVLDRHNTFHYVNAITSSGSLSYGENVKLVDFDSERNIFVIEIAPIVGKSLN